MKQTSLALALLCSSPLFGGTVYWYNGDNNSLGGDLINEVGGANGTSLVYDDFVVGAGGVNITGVFSNDSSNGHPVLTGVTQASWEIRSGVSAGNGGTLIASGTGAATVTDTGQPLVGFGDIDTIEVDGLNIDLAPGTYWLAVAPDLAADGGSYILLTAGANGVGTPQAQDGNSFVNGAADFSPAVDFFGGGVSADGGNIDFSMGVIGSASPEPGTAALGAAAVLLLGFAVVLPAARRRLLLRHTMQRSQSPD